MTAFIVERTDPHSVNPIDERRTPESVRGLARAWEDLAHRLPSDADFEAAELARGEVSELRYVDPETGVEVTATRVVVPR